MRHLPPREAFYDFLYQQQMWVHHPVSFPDYSNFNLNANAFISISDKFIVRLKSSDKISFLVTKLSCISGELYVGFYGVLVISMFWRSIIPSFFTCAV